MSSHDAEQRDNLGTDRLVTPRERVLPVVDRKTSVALGIREWDGHDVTS